MYVAYLLIGGNIGNRSENLSLALRLIGEHAATVTRCSAVFETAPWGLADQAAFLNQAVCVETNADPEKLLKELQKVELMMGRIRKIKNGPRVIDIDILFFDDTIVDLPQLTIPHPLIQERRFALVPMADLEPDLVHPVFHRTILELLAECTDPLEVHLFRGENEV